MSGPLLKSATLKTYHPVGAVGHPVYLAAAQLRAALGRRLGADIADVFAIPQRNEDGDRIDWYAPSPGTVVPWSAATESERVAAQARLLEVRERIEELGRSMEAEVSAERQVFGRLLAHVMQFPDEQDVHLVNGQPVLSFWGFVKDRAEVGSDPLRDLSLHAAPSAGTGALGDQPGSPLQGNRRPWWLWLLLGLLLLLLLALLLWGLRGCAPSDEPTGEPAPMSDSPFSDQSEALNVVDDGRPAADEIRLLETDTVATGGDAGLDAVPDARVDRSDAGSSIRDRVERTVVDGGLSSVRSDSADIIAADTLAAETMIDPASVDADLITEQASVGDVPIDQATALEGLEEVGAAPLDSENDRPAEVSAEALAADLQGAEAGDASATAEPSSDAASADALAAEEDADRAAAEESSASASEPIEEDGGGDGDAVDLVDADEQAGALTAASDTEAVERAPSNAEGPDAAPDAGAPSTDPSASSEPGSAAAPASGLDAGAAADSARAAGTSTGTGAVRIPPQQLLNSSWRTTRALQDPKDGSPVQLDYRLQDGSGKVRLIRKDGSLCQSDAAATVRDGRLVVDSQQDIVCADGTNFGRPQLDCTPEAGGEARCVGRYADGSSVPIEMQRQE